MSTPYSTQSTATQSPNYCPKCHKPYYYTRDIRTTGTAEIICQCQQSKDEDCDIDWEAAAKFIMIEHAPVREALATIDYIGVDVYQALRQLERIDKAAFETVFNCFVEMHKLILVHKEPLNE